MFPERIVVSKRLLDPSLNERITRSKGTSLEAMTAPGERGHCLPLEARATIQGTSHARCAIEPNTPTDATRFGEDKVRYQLVGMKLALGRA